MGNGYSAVSVKDGSLYTLGNADDKDIVYCLKEGTGEEVWRFVYIYADGKFIVLNQWGELTIMEASEKGYKDLCKAKVVETSSSVKCWTAPVLANSKIYIRTNTGDLVCVDVLLPRT